MGRLPLEKEGAEVTRTPTRARLHAAIRITTYPSTICMTLRNIPHVNALSANASFSDMQVASRARGYLLRFTARRGKYILSTSNSTGK